MTPVVDLEHAELTLGGRRLWTGLNLQVHRGEFLTVLGPNGSGKSTLLKVILGLVRLSSGRVHISGRPARRGCRDLGYIPQQSGYDHDIPLRGRDLVALGVTGTRWGLRPHSVKRRVDELIARVGAGSFAYRPLGRLSGGEQQLLRAAQALATEPSALLCDEPLLSLDLRRQQQVVAALDAQRRRHGTSIVFVTHEINPVLAVTDSVLYLHDGRFRSGAPGHVMTSDVLSQLYDSQIEVVRHGDRLAIFGLDETAHHPVRDSTSEAPLREEHSCS